MNALIRYIKESKEELQKVSWPSRKQVVRDTLIVVGICGAMAVFFGALDFGLSTGFQKLIETVH